VTVRICVYVVIQLFSVRYEAAKLIEEEQETELEDVERRKMMIAADTVTADNQPPRNTGTVSFNYH